MNRPKLKPSNLLQVLKRSAEQNRQPIPSPDEIRQKFGVDPDAIRRTPSKSQVGK
jgi:hypothetical protein